MDIERRNSLDKIAKLKERIAVIANETTTENFEVKNRARNMLLMKIENLKLQVDPPKTYERVEFGLMLPNNTKL